MALNGQLDRRTLVDITGVGDYATAATARDFVALRNYVREKFGVTLGVTEAYRDLAAQQRVWDLYNAGSPQVPFRPAPIGQSNHGWAWAIDISGYSLVPGFDDVLDDFGFVRDVAGEGWHIHHVRDVTPAGSPGTLFPEELRGAVDMTISIYINPDEPKENGGGLQVTFSDGRATHLPADVPPTLLKTAGFEGDGEGYLKLNFRSDPRGSFSDAARIFCGVDGKVLVDFFRANPGGTFVAPWARSSGAGGSVDLQPVLNAIAAGEAQDVAALQQLLGAIAGVDEATLATFGLKRA